MKDVSLIQAYSKKIIPTQAEFMIFHTPVTVTDLGKGPSPPPLPLWVKKEKAHLLLATIPNPF